MHNNYYFLQRLAPHLSDRIAHTKVIECFTQNKNELIITFSNGFVIKASLNPSFCCLSFPSTFHRARKNSVNLFEEIEGRIVQNVKQYKNERCFSIDLDEEYQLLFKMHGNRSNVILFKNGVLLKLFKNSLKNDYDLSIHRLDRPIEQTFESFNKEKGDYLKLYPTFGPIVRQHLEGKKYFEKTLEGRWRILVETLELLTQGNIKICHINHSLHLSLLEVGVVQQTFDDPIDAINTFFNLKIQNETFDKEKAHSIKHIDRLLNKTENYIASSNEKLDHLKTGTDYSQIADILMANLHQIPTGLKSIELDNFYQQNKKVRIKLNKNLSPQGNAENYYRKSKNQSKELSILKQNIEAKRDQQKQLIQQIDLIKEAKSLKGLRQIVKKENKQTNKETHKPYSEITYMGYRIMIGKNAKANDAMLRTYTQKNDLWLHARDVSGSHVIIKEIPGRTIPKPVVEKAAELAAYHSKKRSETLCPVIYTPRKFVRKRKGDPPGAVIVEKEQVILVPPKAA